MATIFITGSTDGIGQELAKQYRTQGDRVLTHGRKPLALPDYCQADLSDHDAAQQIVAWLAQQQIEAVDLVIHNAGVGYVGDFATQSTESIDRLIDVNLAAPIALTQALFPHVASADGRFVFIGSLVAALPAPDYAVYGATKAALDGFARSLRVEWGQSPAVTVIHPGATKSGMHGKVGMSDKQTRRFAPTAHVAADIMRDVEKGARLSVIGGSNRLLWRVGKRHGVGLSRLIRPKTAPTIAQHARGKHCVITGGADGIGRALAEAYAQNGYTVTVVDRDGARANAVATLIGGEAVVADLRDTPAWIGALKPVDVFIHNAGISAVGRFETLDMAAQQRVLDINLRAPLQMTPLLIQHGKLKPTSSVVLVSSLSHQMSYPGAASYAASKDGITHYANSLRSALGKRAHVMTVFPGPTRTRHAAHYSPDNSSERRRTPPHKLAQEIFAAQQAGKRALIPRGSARTMARFGRMAPRLAEAAMRRALYVKLDDKQFTDSA